MKQKIKMQKICVLVSLVSNTRETSTQTGSSMPISDIAHNS